MVVKLLDYGKPTFIGNIIYPKEIAKQIVNQINSKKVEYVTSKLDRESLSSASAKINRAFLDEENECINIDIDWLDTPNGRVMKDIWNCEIIPKENNVFASFAIAGSGTLDKNRVVQDDYEINYVVI